MKATTFLQKGLIAVGAATTISLGYSDHAQALTLINFDDNAAPSAFGDTTPLTNEYNSLGISFSGNGAILNELSNFGVDARSGSNFWAFSTRTYATGPAGIVFNSAVSTFSIFASGGGGSTNFFLEVFDASNNLIGSNSFLSTAGSYAELSFDSTLNNIARVQISSLNDNAYVFDDLSFNATDVPTPAAVLPVLGGLLAAARRRKNSETEAA